MARWTYCFIPLESPIDASLQTLNDLGSDGWEAVAVQGPGLGSFVLMKREGSKKPPKSRG
jgi:hypothetical protein